jgi:hypothetical protein
VRAASPARMAMPPTAGTAPRLQLPLGRAGRIVGEAAREAHLAAIHVARALEPTESANASQVPLTCGSRTGRGPGCTRGRAPASARSFARAPGGVRADRSRRASDRRQRQVARADPARGLRGRARARSHARRARARPRGGRRSAGRARGALRPRARTGARRGLSLPRIRKSGRVRPLAEERRQRAHRVDRERGSFALELEPWTRNRGSSCVARRSISIRSGPGGEPPAGLVRGMARRDEDDPVEVEGAQGRARGMEVPGVDGVEGAAEDAETARWAFRGLHDPSSRGCPGGEPRGESGGYRRAPGGRMSRLMPGLYFPAPRRGNSPAPRSSRSPPFRASPP